MESPTWAQQFRFDQDEMIIEVWYQPASFDDAIKFLSSLVQAGGEIKWVEREPHG